MYISVVTLSVADVGRAAQFYVERLGWTVTMDEAMGEGMRWITVAPPGEKTSLTLTAGGPAWSAEKVGGFSGVILEVDDVFATHHELERRGVEFAEPPRREPWGGWAMIVDSEGNRLGLHSPAEAEAEAA